MDIVKFEAAFCIQDVIVGEYSALHLRIIYLENGRLARHDIDAEAIATARLYIVTNLLECHYSLASKRSEY